jgi:hypothetical protein
VSLEAIVCEDASQVWVAAEEHSKHVPHLTLKPVGSGVDGAQARHCCHLVTTHLEGEGGLWIIAYGSQTGRYKEADRQVATGEEEESGWAGREKRQLVARGLVHIILLQ